MVDSVQHQAPEAGAGFSESLVEADGFRIRYREAGQGDALVYIHGGGGLRLSRAQELLAAKHRVIAFEIPGFGASAANERSKTMRELAQTMLKAVAALGIEKFNLMGTSFGGKLSLWMAIEQPDSVRTLILTAPAAIRGTGPLPALTPQEFHAILHAHPEKHAPAPSAGPEIESKQRALAMRLIGPPRDAELEALMAELKIPVLVLFGTEDRLITPDLGGLYREKLPNCHVIYVYDAAHAIDADRPEAVAAIADDFITYREGFVVNRHNQELYP